MTATRRALLSLFFLVVLTGCASKAPAPAAVAAETQRVPIASASPTPAALDLCRIASMPPEGLRSNPDYVQFQVIATGAQGEPVAGLGSSDFIVSAGGRTVPVAYFHRETRASTPVSIVTVVDASATMYRKTIVENFTELWKARAALADALNGLNACDETAMVQVGGAMWTGWSPPFKLRRLSGVTVTQPFTTDLPLVMDQMFRVMPRGQKQLSEGIRVGLSTLAKAHYPYRAMVVFTDGLDPSDIGRSSQLLAQARARGTRIWVIGIGDRGVSGGLISKLEGKSPVDAKAIESLARAAGAPALFAMPVAQDNGASLAHALGLIANELGQGYVVGANVPPGAHPELKLAVSAARLSARVIPSELLAEAAARPAPPRCAQVGTARSRSAGGAAAGPRTIVIAADEYLDWYAGVEGARNELTKFSAGLNRCDEVGLIGFGRNSFLVVNPTTDRRRLGIEAGLMQVRGELERSSEGFSFVSRTNDLNFAEEIRQRDPLVHQTNQTFFDTIERALAMIRKTNRQGAIVLIASTLSGDAPEPEQSISRLLAELKRDRVPVYRVGTPYSGRVYDEIARASGGKNFVIKGTLTERRNAFAAALATISRHLSGNAHQPRPPDHDVAASYRKPAAAWERRTPASVSAVPQIGSSRFSHPPTS